MKVKFSRHAKRRGNLYKIPESAIREVLRPLDLAQGEHEIVQEISGFKLPVKIVVAVEGAINTVITNYPLKKGKTK